MEQYNNYLKIIQKDIGNKTTNNFELDDYCYKVFGNKYKGTHPLDKIPKLKNNESCIFNLDKSNQSGSHWMGLYKHGKNNIVYDSFGRKSKKLMIPLKNIKDTEYDPEQKIEQTDCGSRCVSFLACCYTFPISEVMKI